ncbi:MAG TPA: adenylate/guanylate cyclase domain-containing protein [Bryobacteraceae bacterium]|nr:adenylate/guanylate cyclase domain-containing protein [Bryobacteraceae bacterium]
MKFRTRLLLTFLAVGLLTNGISVGLLFYLARRSLYDFYRAKLLSVTVSVATMIDAEKLKTVQTSADAQTPAYAELQEMLRKVRDANRRKDTYFERMFTVMRSSHDPSVLLFGVDSEERLENHGRLGEVYRAATREGINIDETKVEDYFIQDEFGTFLRAHAPVRDRAGKIIGAVVVASSVNWVESRLWPIAGSALLALLLAAGITIPVVFFLSHRVSKPLKELHTAVEAIGNGNFDTRLEISSRDEFGSVAKAINAMAAGLSERDRVKTAFARYVSHQVMDSILDSKVDKLSGDRRRITVLFSDIRGFTTISEGLAPEKVVQLLNEYFEKMVEVVFRNKGTLDKFIGDGMMVIFGAPEDDEYQEENALKAALEMQSELRSVTEKWRPDGLNLRIGIGINSGPAIVGNIGSSRRMEYTAIGDTVNLASRLESATKELGVGILISEYTHNALRGSFRFKNMGAVQVKGRVDPVLAYSVEEEPVPAIDLELAAK